MIQITTVGRVTADLELKESAKKVPYLRFDLAVTKGYGEGKHTVFLPCLAFQSVAQRMESAGVKKGSQIMISGDLDVVDFERRDGSKGKANKVSVYKLQLYFRLARRLPKVLVQEPSLRLDRKQQRRALKK